VRVLIAARVNGERGEGVSGHHTRAASRLRVRARVGLREGRGGRSARLACAHRGAEPARVGAALSPVVSCAPTRNGEKVSPRIVWEGESAGDEDEDEGGVVRRV
jgi:hypothetical protein